MHSEDARVFNDVMKPASEGRDQIRAFFDGIFAGWPDCRWEKTRAFGQGDLWCMEWTFSGSSVNHPSATTDMWDCGVFKIKNGEVVEVRFYIDTGTIARQWKEQGVV
jgi:limonene-1,2-epoxide hydrolase